VERGRLLQSNQVNVYRVVIVTIKAILGASILLLVSGQVSANLITVQIGDTDGLGIGVLPDETFDYLAIGPADGDGTDEWVFGNQTFNLLYDVSGIGSIESAYLEVFTGGQGYLDISSLYIDNQFVGQLTDGDIGPVDNNIARLDIFDLTSFSSLLDGDTDFSIYTNIDDGWALDYMRLEITSCSEFPGGGATGGCFPGPGEFHGGGVSVVPVPAAIWLFGTAMIGLVGFSKRRKTG